MSFPLPLLIPYPTLVLLCLFQNNFFFFDQIVSSKTLPIKLSKIYSDHQFVVRVGDSFLKEINLSCPTCLSWVLLTSHIQQKSPFPVGNCKKKYSLTSMFYLLVQQVIYHVCNMVFHIMNHLWKSCDFNKNKGIIRFWLNLL